MWHNVVKEVKQARDHSKMQQINTKQILCVNAKRARLSFRQIQFFAE